MKKIYLIPVALLFMSLVACGNNQNNNSNGLGEVAFDKNIDSNVALPTEKNASTLAYQTVTSMVTLSHGSMPAIRMRQVTPEAKTKIETVLPTVDLLLNNATFNSVISESDLADYALKQTVSFTDFNSTTQTMDLYYNVVNVNEKTEEDEYEKETKMEGVVKYQELTYQFLGESEIESEKNEEETELSLKIFTNAEKTDYIKVKQEFEQERNEVEEEYKYEIYQNRKVISSFAFERENENSKEEVKIKLLLDGVKYSFKVYEQNQETFISVKVDTTNDDGVVTYKKVVETDGEGNIRETFIEVNK